MYPIYPLVPFWNLGAAGVNPAMPTWYLESYTMEDRFMQIANRQGVADAWDALAYKKINELVDRVNELEAKLGALENG